MHSRRNFSIALAGMLAPATILVTALLKHDYLYLIAPPVLAALIIAAYVSSVTIPDESCPAASKPRSLTCSLHSRHSGLHYDPVTSTYWTPTVSEMSQAHPAHNCRFEYCQAPTGQCPVPE